LASGAGGDPDGAVEHITYLHAVLLGIVEGITEFLPVSSTGHLTIVERALGYQTDAPGITAFTAIIQTGAVLALVLFLRDDVLRLLGAGAQGLRSARERTRPDFRFLVAVLVGSIPIGIVGLAFKDQIETELRSLWVVAFALIAWSGVMAYADRTATLDRHEDDVGTRDTLFIGVVQCLALVPGVSRSGATMSAGLLRGLDRVTVTRLSFFLSIPALLAAGALEAITKSSDIADGVGWGPTIVATVVSFVVAYASVAWLLRFVARHTYSAFIVYRVALGVLLIGLLASGALSPT
jgi:undecaprenyl-diphosphatase